MTKPTSLTISGKLRMVKSAQFRFAWREARIWVLDRPELPPIDVPIQLFQWMTVPGRTSIQEITVTVADDPYHRLQFIGEVAYDIPGGGQRNQVPIPARTRDIFLVDRRDVLLALYDVEGQIITIKVTDVGLLLTGPDAPPAPTTRTILWDEGE